MYAFMWVIYLSLHIVCVRLCVYINMYVCMYDAFVCVCVSCVSLLCVLYV